METLDRIKSPTPDFFKSLRKWAAFLGTIAGSLIVADQTGVVEFSEKIDTILVVVTTILGSVAGTSFLPKK